MKNTILSINTPSLQFFLDIEGKYLLYLYTVYRLLLSQDLQPKMRLICEKYFECLYENDYSQNYFINGN